MALNGNYESFPSVNIVNNDIMCEVWTLKSDKTN